MDIIPFLPTKRNGNSTQSLFSQSAVDRNSDVFTKALVANILIWYSKYDKKRQIEMMIAAIIQLLSEKAGKEYSLQDEIKQERFTELKQKLTDLLNEGQLGEAEDRLFFELEEEVYELNKEIISLFLCNAYERYQSGTIGRIRYMHLVKTADYLMQYHTKKEMGMLS